MCRVALSALTVAALLSLACGEDAESTPTACLTGPEVVAESLQGPGRVGQLEGGVLLSDCLVDDQPAGRINTVGSAWITVATRLNRTAREAEGKPTRADAATKLGYLVGSAEEGASETGGIHADLVRRLNAAARFTEGGGTTSAAFERSFGAGYAAARAAG